MNFRAAAAVFLIGLFAAGAAGRPQTAAAGAGRGDPPSLENDTLALTMNGPDRFRLTNKLSGRSYDVLAAPFEFMFESGGRTIMATSSEFVRSAADKPSAELLRVRFEGARGLAGLAVEAEYRLVPGSWYVRKRLRVLNGGSGPVVVRDATVDAFRIESVPLPAKAENPVFLDGQIFWGLEWPIAEAAVRAGRLALCHFPAAEVPPGGTWTSKASGFGVSAPGRIEAAFGRYIQDIRANLVDFTTFYFDWLCHDNSGPRESEVLTNLDALRRLKELYGLQFDIYNSDAGLVESQGTYYPEFKANFLSRFPAGLKPLAEASRALGMRLGLWLGPDGFGETPDAMSARREQLLSWVRDFNVGLFKMDTVVSELAHPDRYILEKKYQSLADALSEGRRIDPGFIAINHRINNSPYMLTITDCLLWRGEETYIDVHISNETASLYNRDCSIGRELSSEFFGTPFRQFEDHGICFNSCLEKWEDDLVTQAFGRASVLSPEMYGTFFFLGDGDYPRLARLIQLHKRLEPLLKTSYPLPGGDIAHADGASSLVLVRNMSWEPAVKTIPLDASIGLAAAPGAPLTVRQRHPWERLMKRAGEGAVFGGMLQVELDPFSIRLIQVDTAPPAEPLVAGVPYEIVPGPDAGNFGVKLLGTPGQKADVALLHFGDRTVRTAAGLPVPTGEAPWRVTFPGRPAAGPSFARLADFRDDPAAASDGARLAELAKFTIDDDALEIREMVRLKREPSSLAEIEACRDYMWDKVAAAEGTFRNAFDGDPGTRWSDGFPRRSPFTGSPAAYRSETSLWRIDLGRLTDLARLELRVVRRTDAAFLEAVETSPDLTTWNQTSGLSLAAAEGILAASPLKRRGRTIQIFDVDAGDKRPVGISIPLAGGPCRYVRIRGRNFGVSEILGYDGAGRPLDRSGWRATNFLGETPTPRRVLTAAHIPTWDGPGREYAVAVTAGPAKFDPVDGVYVAALVDGRPVVPRHRAPSYPYHNYEWNSGAPKLAGMTFRLPIDLAWKGKTVEFWIMMFGEGADGARAVLRLVTPKPVFAEIPLRVGPPETLRPAPDGETLSEKQFFDPPLSARPSVLWDWLNGYVDCDQLTRELEEMKAKGLAGAIIWDVGSLSDPKKIIPAGPSFLGPESLASISHAIDQAGRLGLELGLFASSSWNAGGAWIKPENASQRLLCLQLIVHGPSRVRTTVPLPDGVTAHWKDVAVLAVPPAGAAIDISRHVDGEGRVDWDAPAGESRIMRFVASNTGQTLECPSPNSNGLIIDHLSRDAATVDMTYILDRLRSGRKSLDALKTFMLDSYEVAEAVDWTDGFIDAFRERNGYDPVPYLPALFYPTVLDPEIAERFLYDYRKTVSDLIIKNHFRTVRDLLNKRGMRVLAEAGHGGSARVDALKALGSADIPMGEFWNHKQFWVVKEAASAAHIYGKRIVDAETLTGWRNWQDGPAEYKRRFDIALCAGLNHPTFHTFAHNPPAAGRPGFVYHAGEHFNVNTTWWDQAGPLIEYMARCDYLLQQGLFVADVCFYYGDQAPNLVPARRIDPDIEPLYPDTACLHCGKPKPVQTSSLDRGYDYDYVNSEVILERMRVSSGRIVLPDGLRYALLVLPDREDMPLAVLRKIGQLVEAGATVVGRKPVRAPGLAGFPECDNEARVLADRIWGDCDGTAVKERAFGKGRIIWGIPVNDILRALGLGPDFRALGISNADQHVDFIHRFTGRDDIYFVSNSAKDKETFDAVFRVGEERTPEFWSPDTGTIVPCRSFDRTEGGCRLALELPAYGSVFVVFRETPTPEAFLSPAPLKAESRPAVTIAGPWTVRFPPGWGAPESVLWNGLISWTESEDPGIRYFSGTASYTTEFEIGEPLLRENRGWILDLGSLRDVAEVTLNGRSLGILWKEPFQADISDALRSGRNILEVKVTNLWHNRLMGDLLDPGHQSAARTNMVLKAGELIPAGLFGPVTVHRGAGSESAKRRSTSAPFCALESGR